MNQVKSIYIKGFRKIKNCRKTITQGLKIPVSAVQFCPWAPGYKRLSAFDA
jgi:hypothetical protein